MQYIPYYTHSNHFLKAGSVKIEKLLSIAENLILTYFTSDALYINPFEQNFSAGIWNNELLL